MTTAAAPRVRPRADFDPYGRSYSSLSVRDLLDARDAYHVHLCHVENVVATAIGRYLIRADDPDARAYVPAAEAARAVRPAGGAEPGAATPARTLENSRAYAWSWPCVLVFVSRWESPDAIHARGEHVVPPFLYLPDGRIAPTCVVQATPDAEGSGPINPMPFTSGTIGGGYPILSEVQGETHVGSVGCLVTSGDRLYALTNQHVAASPGAPVYALVRGVRTRVGGAAAASLRKVPFSTAYPGFPGTRTFANVDAGLVDVDEAADWTAQVFGLGRLGPMVTFDETTASLDWINCDVVAYGAASGRLDGRIKALFYRYRTAAGADYVADLLIGGRGDAPLPTRPGDSGTLWCVDRTMFAATRDAQPPRDADAAAADDAPTYRPIALQWGGSRLTAGDGGAAAQFALASSLAVICRELDVDVVTDVNAQLPQYWGAVGHYKIAQLAVDRTGGDLRAFLAANLGALTYTREAIEQGKVAHDASGFVPLADVPDLVWKTNINRGAKEARAQENWNHYVDLDLVGADGRTLSDVCGAPPVLRVGEWIDFYHKAPKPAAATGSAPTNMGSLPFRVWQIYAYMVDARARGDAARFLFGAGVLSHYVGDACQPLHGSIHSDGRDGASTGVHGQYEERMIDLFSPDLADALDAFDLTTLPPLGAVADGHGAGAACVELVRRAAGRLPPTRICDTYTSLGGGGGRPMLVGMWGALGAGTVACIADGARTLAALWEAAYAGPHPALAGAIAPGDLTALYNDVKELPSLHLANLDPAAYPAPGAALGAAPGAAPAPHDGAPPGPSGATQGAPASVSSPGRRGPAGRARR